MRTETCPFCGIPKDRIIVANDAGTAIDDAFPLTWGHSLVAPKKHVSSIFQLPVHERTELWELVGKVRKLLLDKLKPDGFNIGLNDGSAAGQTLHHAHIHIIPRYDGDVKDPRGGIRWVIPEKATYWE